MSHSKLVEKIELLETFRKLDSTMPVSQILVFLAVARYPEKSVKEIAELADVPYASAARYVQFLSKGRPVLGEEGLELLRAQENPYDRKQKLLTLTDKGEQLLADLLN